MATAVREWRKNQDEASFIYLQNIFDEMARSVLAEDYNKELAEALVRGAWHRVTLFDLRKKAKAVNYFTNTMKYVLRNLTPAFAVAHHASSLSNKKKWSNYERK